MPSKGTTKHENDHPHSTPPPSEEEGEGGGWFYLHVKDLPWDRRERVKKIIKIHV